MTDTSAESQGHDDDLHSDIVSSAQPVKRPPFTGENHSRTPERFSPRGVAPCCAAGLPFPPNASTTFYGRRLVPTTSEAPSSGCYPS